MNLIIGINNSQPEHGKTCNFGNEACIASFTASVEIWKGQEIATMHYSPIISNSSAQINVRRLDPTCFIPAQRNPPAGVVYTVRSVLYRL